MPSRSEPSPVLDWPLLEFEEPDGRRFVLDEHRYFLADIARTRAFVRAVEALVRPGDVFVDLGCGTGLLSLVACRAGARRVYAVERRDIIHLARRVAEANHCADRITFVHDHARAVTLDEPADVIAFEHIGSDPVNGTLVSTLGDVRTRWLRPGGSIVPRAIDGRFALVSIPDAAARRAFWRQPVDGFDLGAAEDADPFTVCSVMPDDALSDWGTVFAVDLTAFAADAVRGETTLHVHRAGRADGLAGVFDADLAPGIRFTNDPRAAERSPRLLFAVPFREPLDVAPGDEVTVAAVARVMPVARVYRITQRRAGRVIRRIDVHDFRLDAAHLTQTLDDTRLGRRDEGRAAWCVLRHADGTRTLDALATLVGDEFPELFSRRTARRFCRDVLHDAAKQR